MKAFVPNVHTRKVLILIPVLVIIPLIGLGLYVGPNLLDTMPPTLTVRWLGKEQTLSWLSHAQHCHHGRKARLGVADRAD